MSVELIDPVFIARGFVMPLENDENWNGQDGNNSEWPSSRTAPHISARINKMMSDDDI